MVRVEVRRLKWTANVAADTAWKQVVGVYPDSLIGPAMVQARGMWRGLQTLLERYCILYDYDGQYYWGLVNKYSVSVVLYGVAATSSRTLWSSPLVIEELGGGGGVPPASFIDVNACENY